MSGFSTPGDDRPGKVIFSKLSRITERGIPVKLCKFLNSNSTPQII